MSKNKAKSNNSEDKPELINPEDLEIHKRMIVRFKQAEVLIQQAQELEAQANRLNSGFGVWAEDLHEKYGLDASQGEGVEEDGRIIRKSRPGKDVVPEE